MLVEDNETDRLVITEVLEQCDLAFRLRIAQDGSDALAFLEKLFLDENALCPGLVLLDLNLPRISGIEVLKQIRSAARCNRIPVIIITSSESEEDRGAAQRLNADAYFRKPSSLPAYLGLAEVIQQVLHRRNKSAAQE